MELLALRLNVDFTYVNGAAKINLPPWLSLRKRKEARTIVRNRRQLIKAMTTFECTTICRRCIVALIYTNVADAG